MEQVKNAVGTLLQAAAMQTGLPQGSKSEGTGDDFQKLMDKAAAASGKKPDTQTPAKADTPTTEKTGEAPVGKEDALSRIKKMLEQHGTFAFQPNWQNICIDMESGETTAVYNPGEWVMVFTGEEFEAVPTADLEPWQQAQLKQLLVDPNPIDVSDPKLEAMLKATAPDADTSPAAMLENAVAGQFGKVIRQTSKELGADSQEGDAGTKLLDADQAPQQLFRDVESTPIKVGEAYQPEQAEKADVPQQVDNRVLQALESGESSVRIELTPEYLGSVTVEISRSADGILKVALSAHSSETRGLLERHASDLQGLLGRGSNQTVEVEVQRQSESQQGQNQQNYDGHNGQDHSGQEQQHRRRDEQHSRDFAQQLRLGLIPTDVEAI